MRGPAHISRFIQFLAPLLLAAAAGCSVAGFAQDNLRLERLEIAIWPEYDRPAALVMLRAWLPTDIPLPETIPLPVPAGATVNAVAKRGPDGTLLLAKHFIEHGADWNSVEIEADVPEIRLEYYASLDTSTPERRFNFLWPGGLDIGAVSYELQHPFGASDFLVTPPQQSQQAGFDGLTYHFGALGAKGETESFFIELAYTKASPGLTIASLQPPPAQGDQSSQPSTANGPSSPVQTGTGDSSMWLAVLPIVLLVGLVVIWFAISGSASKVK